MKRNCHAHRYGDGAIIAAYSVVAKDIPPYTVASGLPCCPIKPRFDAELMELLLRLKWWNFDPQTLASFLPDLCSPDLDHVRAKIRRMLEERER